MSFETAIHQWRDGERRLRGAQNPVLHDVVDAILAELRRRLGGTFDTEELVVLYEEGTDWCLDVAARVAPDDPEAWEASTVADAAFARYLHAATDYAGGRRLAL